MKVHLSPLLLACVIVPGTVAQTSAANLTRHIEAARQAQARQDCSTAAKEYGDAVRLLPGSGELRTNQGIALYCDQRYTEAVEALRKALTLNPALAVPHLFLGLSAFHLSEHATAIRELSSAVQKMPADATAHLWLGYALVEDHQNDRAAEEFQTVLRLQPANVDARYALGQSYFDVGRSRGQQLASLYPNGRGIRLLVAQQTAIGGASASQLPQGAPAWKTTQEETLYQQALSAEQQAQQTLQQVLDLYPNSDRAHQILGDIASLQRKNEDAIREYMQVIQMNPSLPGTRLALANCLMQVAQFDRALDALKQEEALTPRSANVLALIGRVQLALGKDNEAIASLKAAMSLPAAPPAARLLLGKSLLRTGDAKAAVPLLEQALRDGADPATTNYLLARAYRTTGDRAAMAKALDAYHHFSQDETEREAASAITQGPASLPTAMSAQEVQDASNMSVSNN